MKENKINVNNSFDEIIEFVENDRSVGSSNNNNNNYNNNYFYTSISFNNNSSNTNFNSSNTLNKYPFVSNSTTNNNNTNNNNTNNNTMQQQKRKTKPYCTTRNLNLISLTFGLAAAGSLSLAASTDFWLYTEEPVRAIPENETFDYPNRQQKQHEQEKEMSSQQLEHKQTLLDKPKLPGMHNKSQHSHADGVVARQHETQQLNNRSRVSLQQNHSQRLYTKTLNNNKSNDNNIGVEVKNTVDIMTDYNDKNNNDNNNDNNYNEYDPDVDINNNSATENEEADDEEEDDDDDDEEEDDDDEDDDENEVSIIQIKIHSGLWRACIIHDDPDTYSYCVFIKKI
ncbi:hypothetical protein HELRODRAFT_160902 [Helobdella robusta]|uniref:Uncharacterized protein n=1 Tax=Helobdella robusta TaxID=6412 RepID=T1EQU5_HELRO|nr:hypothetical protein HELRODRAFT_160902 [Helobdella robusta]ESO06708.1 hypothetical protein HELRODRAFT_160902 [Helobdella robusta]